MSKADRFLLVVVLIELCLMLYIYVRVVWL